MHIRPATADDADDLDRLFVATGGDGVEPLSEYKALRVLEPELVREAVLVGSPGITCYAQAAWHRPVVEGGEGHWGVEIATVAALAESVEVVRFLVAGLEASTRWVLWARRDGDVELARRLGLRETRSLHELAVSLPVRGRPVFPDGVRVAPFRMGEDEAAWLTANNASFAGHPENGALDTTDLDRRFSEPWFDPAGIRMAWQGDRLLGSCWTKVHPSGDGEIYIIGVVPAAQGRGLGTALVLEGLRYLSAERDVARAMLWVEATNRQALAMYDRIGFERIRSIHQFEP